jgi:hypothetical protein
MNDRELFCHGRLLLQQERLGDRLHGLHSQINASADSDWTVGIELDVLDEDSVRTVQCQVLARRTIRTSCTCWPYECQSGAFATEESMHCPTTQRSAWPTKPDRVMSAEVTVVRHVTRSAERRCSLGVLPEGCTLANFAGCPRAVGGPRSSGFPWQVVAVLK